MSSDPVANPGDRRTTGVSRDAFEPPGPVEISPRESEVHVWLATLDPLPEPLHLLRQSLSPEELARAEGFRFDRDRDAYVAGRAIVRRLLSRYLGCPAEKVSFARGVYGKPALVSPDGGMLRFNLSHSDGLALFAVAFGREVGIDIEKVRAAAATSGLAERFFSSDEIAALRLLRGAEREAAFFACWTRKEAYVKARGEGLSLPLRSFSVTVDPDREPALTRCGGEESELNRWMFRDVRPGPEWAATLVAEGRDWELRRWRWAPT